MGFSFQGFCRGTAEDKAKNNAIWVIVDKLTKTAHFLAMANTWTLDQLAHAYLDGIVYLIECPAP